MDRRYCLVIAGLFIVLFSNCKVAKNAVEESKIIYRVSDSLEAILFTDMNEHTTSKASGIAIDPKCIKCFYSPLKRSPNYFRIGMIYKDDLLFAHYKNVLDHSNRYVQIHDELYPVFIVGMDCIFMKHKKRNNISCDSLTAHFSNMEGNVIANIARLKYITDRKTIE